MVWLKMSHVANPKDVNAQRKCPEERNCFGLAKIGLFLGFIQLTQSLVFLVAIERADEFTVAYFFDEKTAFYVTAFLSTAKNALFPLYLVLLIWTLMLLIFGIYEVTSIHENMQ